MKDDNIEPGSDSAIKLYGSFYARELPNLGANPSADMEQVEMTFQISIKFKIDYKRILILLTTLRLAPYPWVLATAFLFLTIESDWSLASSRNACNLLLESLSMF